MRRAAVVVAIVELGDVAPAEHFAELQEAALALRDLHRHQRFALAADVGALGDVTQAVEVHVRAAVDRDEAPVAALLACDVALDACDRQRSRRLDDRAVVFEDVLDRRADLVRADGDHLVDVFLRQPERLLADPPHGDAVRKDADALQRDALTFLQRAVHRIRVFRLHADHADLRKQVLHVRRDARDQAAAADGDEDRIERLAGLLPQDLHADRALAGDHVGVVERMNESELALARDRQRVIVSLVVFVAVQDHLAAEVDHRLHFDARRGLRHHDRRRDAAALGSECDALRMVAGRGADHAAPGDGLGQMRDLVVRAAHLEREHRLQVLALEQHGIAESAAQARRIFERRLDRDVVHARLEDAFEILV